MRRKRTLAVSASSGEDGHSSSPRHALSPRSPLSQGTFDSSMEINSACTGYASTTVGGGSSTVGSVIGHDDPTLIHANLHGCSFSSGLNDSATLGSFVTEVTAEEIRDSLHTSRLESSTTQRELGSRTMSDAEFLAKELSELDMAQEAWKVRHQNQLQLISSTEMDSTGDFYLDEVGGFHRQISSPRHKNIALQEQIIPEEDEFGEEFSQEPIEDESSTDRSNVEVLANSHDEEVVMVSRAAPPTASAEEDMKIVATASDVSVASSVVESVPSDLVYEYPSTEESDGRGTPTQHSGGSRDPTFVNNPVTVFQDIPAVERTDEVVPQEQNQLRGSSSNPIEPGFELQYEERGIPMEGERATPPPEQTKKGFRSWIPVGDDSDSSRSWFKHKRNLSSKTNSSEILDESVVDAHRKRRRKLCCLNICLVLVVIAVVICSILFTLTFRSRQNNAQTEANMATPTIAPITGKNPENPTFNLTAPSVSPIEESPSLGTPTSDGPLDDAESVDSPFSPSPLTGSPSFPEDGDASVPESSPPAPIAPSDSGDPGGTAPSRTAVPTANSPSGTQEDPSLDTPSPTTSPSILTPTGKESPFDDVLSPTSSPTQADAPNIEEDSILQFSNQPSLTGLSGRVDGAKERLREISGDVINDPATPQYKAYDWLSNEDPANLDLDNLSDQELTQRYTAALLYYSLNGDSWVDRFSFMSESHVCDWNNGSPLNRMGIICDSPGTNDGFEVSKYGPVTAIVLNDNNLNGNLPGELQALIGLKTIQLRSNNVAGTVPSELGNLSALQEIDIRENELWGTVPESIFTLPDIRNILLLRNSNLGGTISSSIDKASNLEMLSFQKCQLTGTIPDSVQHLSHLFFVTFMDNNLSGSIPPGLTQLPMLEVLELSGNQLSGPIPQFAGQTSLYFLSLFDNQLTGSIPESLSGLSGLNFLDIRDNLLSGTIPSIVGRLPNLVTFFAQNNQLTGALPSFSGNAGLLQAVNLSNNNLSGDLYGFFSADGPSGRLFSVDLRGNNFSGSLPLSIGGYDALKVLILEDNGLTGTIPIEIGALTDIDTLVLRNNNLSGELPEEIGFIVNLVHLDIAVNQFGGTIPDTLIMLPELEVLDLESNNLVGSVPSTFAMLSNLNELYLQSNDLQGDLTSTFCSTSQRFGIFISDCLGPNPKVTCDCCTTCCNNEGCEDNT